MARGGSENLQTSFAFCNMASLLPFLFLLLAALDGWAGPGDESGQWETGWLTDPTTTGSSTAARPPPSLSGSGASSSSPSAWPGSSAMTHADRIAYMSAAWDEEISLGLQEDEFEEAAATILSCSGGLSPALPPDAPLPGDIPLPFGSWSSSLGCASQAEVNPTSGEDDWLVKVMDTRVLRRRGTEASVKGPVASVPSAASSSSPIASWTSSESSSLSSAPSASVQLPPDTLPTSSSTLACSWSSSWCSSLPSASSSSSSCAGTYCASTASTQEMNSSQIAVDSTHSADSVDSAEEGVTYRWGVRQPGRDRWHNADGSLINRGRARPSPLEDPVATFSPASGDHGRPGEVGPVAGGDGGRLRVGGLAPVPEEQMVEPDEQPFTITGSGQVDGAPVLKGVTFYGREFLVRGNSNEDSGDSTTAGEDSEDTEAYEQRWLAFGSMASGNLDIGPQRNFGLIVVVVGPVVNNADRRGYSCTFEASGSLGGCKNTSFRSSKGMTRRVLLRMYYLPRKVPLPSSRLHPHSLK